MTHRILRFTAFLSVFGALSFHAPTASADTYAAGYYGLNDDVGQFVAADDFGDTVIVLYQEAPCGGHVQNCYLVNLPGAARYETTIPTLRVDPSPPAGSGCVAAPSTFFGTTFCNNGHELFSGTFDTPTDSVRGLFDGTDPLIDKIFGDQADGHLVFTASGDLYFDDGAYDVLAVARDVTSANAIAATPEPSTWLLLGTGVLAMGGLLRKRQLSV